jgi:hypothetical protein
MREQPAQVAAIGEEASYPHLCELAYVASLVQRLHLHPPAALAVIDAGETGLLARQQTRPEKICVRDKPVRQLTMQ